MGVKVRSAFEWLADLQRARADATRGERSKVTIADVIERANALHCTDPSGKGSLEPTSPRSVEACLRLGVEPSELHFMPLDIFLARFRERDLADIAYNHHETVRQERLAALLEERKKMGEVIQQSGSRPTTKGGHKEGAEGGEMVEKEAKRLEVLKRRQERELNQLVHYELMRKALQDKAEAKLAAMEARAEEQRRARAKADAEWRQQQRERELKRAEEERQREKEVKALEAARYAQEQKEAHREAMEERARRRQAHQHEQERRAKAEEARAEAERVLSQQAAELERKKAEMVAREAEREQARQAQAEETFKRNGELRQRAEARIAAALEANAEALRQRRAAFGEKQALTEERALQKEEARQAQEAAKRRQDAESERARRAAYSGALRREADRIAAILAKQRTKDMKVEELHVVREHESACRKLKHRLDLGLKRDKVEAMQRRAAYERDQLLVRIQCDTEKAHELLAQRTALQEQRRAANMEASFQRQKLMQVMDMIKAKKKWDALASGNGHISIDSLIRV
ncbi:g4737 [Coccomyxa viridis]|uniref:G4737 protein n=1 Tax=Coccomyxa viridis TaxID=1274662 RepID=A0ABP1FTN8_9CHLO